MNRLLGWVLMVVLSLCCAVSLMANELVRGKVIELTSTRLVVRLPDGQKKTIYLNEATKFMHRPGSGEQSEPPKPRKNDRIVASLEGDTAVFVVVEEVPK